MFKSIKSFWFNFPCWILLASSIFHLFWFRLYFSSSIIPSVDMPGHIYIVERLVNALGSGSLFFYDPAWFSGWPAFQFYGFLPHLFAALFSVPLGLISAEPCRLAVHLLSIFGCALLPYSMYFFLSGFYQESDRDKPSLNRSKTVLALTVAALSFWFLNHDRQWYGVGAAAPLNIGLFSQTFGWHFFLLHIACLLRFVQRSSRVWELGIAVCFALLFISHSLTAVYSGFLVFLSICWFSQHRWKLFRAHLLALGLVSFWLVPFFSYSGTYTTLDIYRPEGDFLEIFFRYPLTVIIDNFNALYSGGKLSKLNPTTVFLWVLALLAITHRSIRKSNLYFCFLVFLPIAVVVFSSGFIASSIPMGLHYYRFHAYNFLLLTALLAWPIAAIMLDRGIATTRSLLSLTWILAAASIWFTASFPHYERERIIQSTKNPNFFEDEKQVLEQLKQLKPQGRVFLEYFDNYNLYPFLSAHYMTSKIFKETGREVLNGLFLQSALAYRMPVVSANLLGANTYNTPLLFSDRAILSRETKLQQLRDFGISHIVTGHGGFRQNLNTLLPQQATRVGRYSISNISKEDLPLVRSLDKTLVAYYDQEGSLPFQHLEFFLYARDKFYSNMELVELDSLENIPQQVKLVIVNGSAENAKVSASQRIIQLDYQSQDQINHYQVRYQHNFELDDFNQVEQYLTRRAPEISAVLGASKSEGPSSSKQQARLTWKTYGKEIELSGLEPGRFYRVNYSYFPYWQAEGGRVFRGFGERIFVLAEADTLRLEYSRLSKVSTWLGLALSLVSVLVSARYFFREKP